MIIEPSGTQNSDSDDKKFILPPSKIRLAIDKTIDFILENGEFLEETLKNLEDSKEKFPFLHADNFYNAYYSYRYQQKKNNVHSEIKTPIPRAIVELKTQKAEKMGMIKFYSDNFLVRSKYEFVDTESVFENVYSKYQYNFILPTMFLSKKRDRIIKLTAYYVALYGKEFLDLLNNVESQNLKLNFLNVGDNDHKYFLCLVDQYKLILDSDSNLIFHLKLISSDVPFLYTVVLIKHQQEMIKKSIELEIQKEKDKLNKKEEISHLEWGKFVVITRVMFSKAEKIGTLPFVVWEWDENTTKHVSGNDDIISVNQTNFDNFVDDQQKFELNQRSNPSYSEENTIKDEAQQETTKSLNIRKTKKSVPQVEYIKCPITGALIAADSFKKHLKVLLLNKKWKKEKEELKERMKADTNYTQDHDIETNIINFMNKRPEIFNPLDGAAQTKNAAKRFKNDSD